MKVLVVGGAGYVGCVLVRELLSRGHGVRVWDRLFFGDEGLTDIRSRIELEVGDIRRIAARDLEGTDAVINLAGISSDPTAEFRPGLTREMNVAGAIRLAQACKQAGVRRYLFASSCSVYDCNVVDDATDVLFDETSQIQPVSAYARSKVEAEKALLALADHTFGPVLIRKGTVYGLSARMRYDLVVNTLLKDALARGVMTLNAGGEMWRPVIEVSDAARAYVACLEAGEGVVAGHVFNVVSGNMRVAEMALRIREALAAIGIHADLRSDYRQRPVRSYRVSGAKLQQALGFHPEVSIKEAVKRAVVAVREHGAPDWEHPSYYNIRWFAWLESEHRRSGVPGTPFDC